MSVIAQDSGSTTALLRAHLDSGAEGVEYVEHALGDDNNKKMASDKTPTLPLDDVVVPTGGTIPASVQIWLEAENGQLTSPMITGNDSTASSGQYIWTLESARDVGNAAQNGGTARDTVQVTTADTFVIWTRVYPSSDGNGAFYLAMDGKPSLTWDIPFPLVGSAAGQEAVSITSPTAYEVATIQVGHEQYIDRTYTVTALPPTLDGLVAIKTANGDRSNTSTTFLTLTLTADATLYVAYASLADPLPYWLTTGFTPTGLTIDTTDAPLSVWEREVSAGTVTLPGNKHGSPGEGGSNYIVLLEFHNGRRTPTWRWFQVAQDSTPVFFLEPGAHTLTVKHCRSGTKLDRLLVTNDLDFVPAD